MSRLELRRTAEQLRRDYAHLLTAPRVSVAPEAVQPARDALDKARDRLAGRATSTGPATPIQLTLDA